MINIIDYRKLWKEYKGRLFFETDEMKDTTEEEGLCKAALLLLEIELLNDPDRQVH